MKYTKKINFDTKHILGAFGKYQSRPNAKREFLEDAKYQLEALQEVVETEDTEREEQLREYHHFLKSASDSENDTMSRSSSDSEIATLSRSNSDSQIKFSLREEFRAKSPEKGPIASLKFHLPTHAFHSSCFDLKQPHQSSVAIRPVKVK